ncbi:MAG: AAA family ATPase, partial [Bacteroidota bacterium]
MIKIPYGISNFKQLRENDYYLVDKTKYIEQLEQFNQRFLFFVRPRRFGKSLFLSILEHYYDIRRKDEFMDLFGPYYIGQQPTKLANQYLILKFNFSGIDTRDYDSTFKSFLFNVKHGVKSFLIEYADYFGDEDINGVDYLSFPAQAIQYLYEVMAKQLPPYKIYLLIDEYDHFANEILAFRFEEFSQIVSRNGYVRKFFEAIKIATGQGVIDRLFVTGVSTITLDSLTSGFNISTNITLSPRFHDMVGFKTDEVETILRGVNVSDEGLPNIMEDLKVWYDGYAFSRDVKERLYNSDMVLYFADHYSYDQSYPDDLLDINIASDYTKVRRLFKIKNREKEQLRYLDDL